MANLLPPVKALEQAEDAAAKYLALIQAHKVMHRNGFKPKKEAKDALANAYSKLASAQWEMEQVLK